MLQLLVSVCRSCNRKGVGTLSACLEGRGIHDNSKPGAVIRTIAGEKNLDYLLLNCVGRREIRKSGLQNPFSYNRCMATEVELANLSEKEFTQSYLLPLYKAKGYQDVDYY